MSHFSLGIILLGLTFLLVAHKANGQLCDPTQVQKCQAGLTAITGQKKDGMSMLPENVDQKQLCREFQNAMDCISSFLDRCIPKDSQPATEKKLKNYINGIKEYLKNVCDENSQLYKDSKKHSECLATVKPETDACSANLQSSIQRQATSTESMTKKTEAMCCTFQRLFDCINDAVKGKCGDDAAKLMQSSLKMAVGGLIEDDCFDESGNPKCSSAFTARPAAILFALAAIFWTFQRKLW